MVTKYMTLLFNIYFYEKKRINLKKSVDKNSKLMDTE